METKIGPLKLQPGYPWRLHGALLAPVLALVLCLGLSPGFWGEPVRLFFEQLRLLHPDLTAFMRFVTDKGIGLLYAVYALILLRALYFGDTSERRFALRYAVGLIVFQLLLTSLLKESFGLPRPGHPLPPQPFSFVQAYLSFPSGHTVNIVTAALPLALRYRQAAIAVVLALLVALVCFSRLWLGAHHPVDLLGGMLVGSLAARWIFLPQGQTSPPR